MAAMQPRATSRLPLLCVCLAAGLIASVAAAPPEAQPPRGRRALLAKDACSGASARLLTNAFFSRTKLDTLNNHLVAAALANDAYPWARQFGMRVADVVQGLTPEQVRRYQRLFTAKYGALGASNVQFADYYSPDRMVAGHAAVVGTPSAVFVTFRGTADMGQGWTSADISYVNVTVMGKVLHMYKAPALSVAGVWPQVLSAVRRAIAATDSPSAAKVYLTGHSLGGASAQMGGLLLKEAGINVGGVWAFGPYKAGTTCKPSEDCWVTLYDRHLADQTWVWWNNQDPIPALLDSALGTSFANSQWGHVPREGGWMRVVGDQCLRASGALRGVCPREVDAVDGAADGVCSKPFVQFHYPWSYLQKVARCALLQGPGQAAARRDSCQHEAVWATLLGLPPPGVSVQGLVDASQQFAPDDPSPLSDIWAPEGQRRIVAMRQADPDLARVEGSRG